jgi:chemotaxis protein MotB
MQSIKFSGLLVLFICGLLVTGCATDLEIQNQTQRKRISELNSEVQALKLKLDQAQRGLETARGRGGVEMDALEQKITALEEDLRKKKSLIETMQQQLLYGGMALPVELSTLLEDFAEKEEMVTYDADRGIVKFKSDLLFERGSDVVSADAAKALQSLCNILIAGHTDDMRIGRPETRQKHPTNWHLSAHRGISVLNLMTKNNVTPERLSVRGFGEYRPIEPNKPGQKGNPQNRRVEIYIVAKGV